MCCDVLKNPISSGETDKPPPTIMLNTFKVILIHVFLYIDPCFKVQQESSQRACIDLLNCFHAIGRLAIQQLIIYMLIVTLHGRCWFNSRKIKHIFSVLPCSSTANLKKTGSEYSACNVVFAKDDLTFKWQYNHNCNMGR